MAAAVTLKQCSARTATGPAAFVADAMADPTAQQAASSTTPRRYSRNGVPASSAAATKDSVAAMVVHLELSADVPIPESTSLKL